MRLIFFELQKICVKWSASYLASYFVSMIIINGKNVKIFCIMAHAKKCRGDRGYMGQILEKIFKLDF